MNARKFLIVFVACQSHFKTQVFNSKGFLRLNWFSILLFLSLAVRLGASHLNSVDISSVCHDGSEGQNLDVLP